MIDTNYSSQDYFLMFKNSLIASIFAVLMHMARNHFITHDGFPVFFFCLFVFFKKNQSRGKCNLVIYVMYWQKMGERGDVLQSNILIKKGLNFPWSML